MFFVVEVVFVLRFDKFQVSFEAYCVRLDLRFVFSFTNVDLRVINL